MGADRATLTAAFDRFVRNARRRGDSRRTRLLAQDLLGESTWTDDAAVLVSALPLTVRLGLVTPRRIATAVTGAVLLALGRRRPLVGCGRHSSTGRGALVMVRDRSGSRAFGARSTRSDGHPAAVTVKARGRPRWRIQAAVWSMTPRPGSSGSWALTVQSRTPAHSGCSFSALSVEQNA
jgi:hypothetical protein